MKTRQVLAGALSASLLLTGLPGLAFAQDAETQITPEAVEWTLATLAGEAVPEGVTTTLFMSGGEVVGDAGCNSYFGSYELDGDLLTFPTPFGSTLKLCEDEAMAVEGAYLPLLQATQSWAIDEAGALSLADADGTVQLVYGEATVDVTASDVDALVATLGDLQAQIDAAAAEVAAVAAETAAIPVNKFDKRVKTVESEVARLDKSVKQLENRTQGLNVQNLGRRISTLEETVARLDRTIDRFRERILALEATAQDHEQRLAELEAQP
jgi:heat shock protein HslJ